MRPLRLVMGLAATAGTLFAASCMRDRLVSPDTPLPAVLAVDRPTVQLFRFARGRMVGADTVRISNNGAGDLGPVQRLGGVDYLEGRTGWLDARVVNVNANEALLILQATYAEEEQQQADRAEVILKGAGAAELKRVAIYARTLPGARFEFSVSPAAFTAAPGEPPSSQSLIVRNGGNGVLLVHPPTIQYEGAATGWLSVVRAGGTETAPLFSIQANPGGLAGGLHQARLDFSSLPSEETRALGASVPVQLNVGTPRLGVSTSKLGFSVVYGGPSPAAQTVLLSNAGAGSFPALGQIRTLSITYGAGATNWLQVTVDTARAVVTADPAGLKPGSYSATLILHSDAGGDQGVQAVLAVEAPRLTLSSRTLSFGLVRGEGSIPAAQSVKATNTGAGTTSSLGTLTLSPFSPTADWVVATVSGNDVTVAPTPAAGSLTVATHSTRLAVTSPYGGSDTLTVSLAVSRGADVPVLSLSAADLTFSATRGDPGPPPQVVRAFNAGGGTLGTLALGSIDYAGPSGWLTPTIKDTTVTLTVNPAGLPDGLHGATFRVISATGGDASLRVQLKVASPILTLSASSVSFSSQVGGEAGATRTITLANTGPGTLATLGNLAAGQISYGSGSGWLSAALNGATLTLTLASVPGSAGSYEATVPVTSGNGGVTEVKVALTVAAAPTAPQLAVSPGSVSMYAVEGGSSPAAQTLLISNSGGGTLGTVTATSSQAWLTASVSGSTVTLNAAAGSLPAGSHSATVTVSANPGGSEVVNVVLEVKAPRLTLSSTSASFRAVQGAGSATPAVVPVTVSNTGGGDFSALGTVTLGAPTYAGTGGWLSAQQAGSDGINLTANPGTLGAGTYTAQVAVASVRGGSETIGVTFTVTPIPAAPDLLVSPAALKFAAETSGSNPAKQYATISNAGGGGVSDLGTLSLGSITYGSGSGWLTRTLNGADIEISVTTGSLAAGTYTASFGVSGTTGGAAETVSVQFDVFDAAEPADLELAAGQVEFAALAGGSSPAQRTVSIYNAGADRLGTITLGTITYGAGASGWLSTSDVSNTALTLKPVLGSMGGGTYTAQVVVNSQYGGAATVDVALRVGQPDLKLNPGSVSFAAKTGGGDPSGQSMLLANGGAGTFADLGSITRGTVTYGSGGSGWLTASVSGSSIDLSVTTGSLAAATYTATFPVSASNGGADETATVQFDVVADASAPALALGTSQIDFGAVRGGSDPAARTVAIFNRGTGDLGAITTDPVQYGAGASGWLSATASSTQLTLAPTLGGLAAGSYTATVQVKSTNGGNATVAVAMVVGAPDLALSLNPVSFAGTARGPNPNDQTIVLTNAGAGTYAQLGAVSLGGITYSAGATDWIATRTLSPDGDLTLKVGTGSLSAGTYTASFAVSSTVGGSETVNVNFELVPEAAPPLLGLGTTQVDFSAVAGSASPAAGTVPIINLGTGNLGSVSVGGITYGSGSGWLSASATSTTLTLTPTTTSLVPGTYTATVPVSSANGGSTSVSVALRVGLPDLTLSTASVSFAAAIGASNPAAQVVKITNSGAGTFDQLGSIALGSVSYGAGASGWLSPNRSGADLTLNASIAGLPAGSYTAGFTVSSTAGGSESESVSLTVADAAQAPALALSAANVNFEAVKGAPPPPAVTIALSNSGGGNLASLGTLSTGTIAYGSGSGWLGTPQIVGSALTLTPSTSGLNEGTYSATVPVRSQSGGNQSLTVTLRVVRPVLTSSALSLSFTALAGGSAPAPQALTLSNTGGGTFADLGALLVQSVSYGAGATGWLQLPRAGSGITTSSVEFEVSPAGLAPGRYAAQVVLSSQYGSTQTVTVTISIVRETDPPKLVLSVPTQRFSALVGGADPEPQSVELANAGGRTLGATSVGNVSYGAGAADWLRASLTGTTLTTWATTGGLAKGSYTAAVTINSDSGGSASLDVTFVVGSPRLTLTPRTVSFADTLGGPGPAPFTVNAANTGGGNMGSLGTIRVRTVSYTGEVTGWLTADTIATSSIVLTARTSGLGSRPTPYEARVLVASTNGGEDTVTVAFTVAPGGAPPRLALSLDTLRFAGLIGQGNPAPQEVSGFNAGGGSLGAVGISNIVYGAGAAGWLTTSIDGQRVILAPSTGSLSAATYQAQVTVASANGGSAPLQVVMELGQPLLRLSTRTITFSDTVGSREVLRSQVFVSNAGAGTRTDLGRIELGTISYPSGGAGWLLTTPAPGQSVDGFLASVEARAADVPEGTSIAKVPFRSQWGGTDTLTVSLTARRPDRSFDLPTIELVKTSVVNGVPVVQRLTGDSVVVTAQARTAAQIGLRLGIRNAADTRLTLSGLRVGMPTYTVGKSGWISGAFLDKTSATLSAPAELFVAIEPAALDAGRYEAQLVVRSEAVGLAQVVPVTVRIILLVQ